MKCVTPLNRFRLWEFQQSLDSKEFLFKVSMRYILSPVANLQG